MLPLVALALSAAASTAAPEHVLPMWMQAGNPSVAITIDGRHEPLRFVVDSAAGASVVDNRIVSRYGLEDDSGKAANTIHGASSSSAVARRMRVADWKAGDVTFRMKGMQADLGALSDASKAVVVDGILGNDITRRWDTRWDFAANQLALWPADALPGGAHCQSNALPDRKPSTAGFGFINMRLGDSNVDAIAVVDTGATHTILNFAAARALGLRTDGNDPRVTLRPGGLQGLGGQLQASWSYTLSSMGTAGWQHPAFEVRVSALPVFKILELEERPALILGTDAMLGSQIDIGAGARRICLNRQPSANNERDVASRD